MLLKIFFCSVYFKTYTAFIMRLKIPASAYLKDGHISSFNDLDTKQIIMTITL